MHSNIISQANLVTPNSHLDNGGITILPFKSVVITKLQCNCNAPQPLTIKLIQFTTLHRSSKH